MHQLTGITPAIDSCRSMIAQKASRTYSQLPAHHRRWNDPEDILQEALLAALVTEQHHISKFPSKQKGTVQKGGAKFSTYLYTGLDYHLSRFQTLLHQKKRSLTGVVELDAPRSEEDTRPVDLEDVNAQVQEGRANCIRAFVTLCRAVSQQAIVMLIRGFLFSDVRRATPELCKEVREKAVKLGIGISDFGYLGSDEKMRRNCLTQVSSQVILGSDTEASLRCLECVECTGQFTVEAIRNRRFFVSTMTCYVCYRKMQRQASLLSCFGKPKRPGHEGFSEADVECTIHCPDKVICRQLSKEPIMSKKKSVEDVDFSDVEGKAKPTAKAAPASAKAKTTGKKKLTKVAAAPKPKVVEDDEEPVPAGMVRWPFKRGSWMRYLFQQMYAGCNAKEIEKTMTAAGAKWPFMLSVMRLGLGGRGHVKTHTFKLNEEGGRFKISDVKYTGPKEAKAEKSGAAPKGKTKAAAATSTATKAAPAADDEDDED